MFETIYDDFFYLKGILELPICLIGDMNSRTGELDDILTFEREVIHSCETNGTNDVFVDDFSDLSFFEDNNILSRKRVNKDKIINENGKDLINLCKRNTMIIINGRTGSDREIGEVTFQSKNGKSTIDYCITSPDFIPHIQDFQVDILDQNLSDKHSPIFLTLKTKLNENPINPNDIPHKTDINYDPLHSKWNEEKMPEFQTNFNQTKINNLFQILEYIETNGSDLQEIDKIVDETANISISAGINTNMSKKPTSEIKHKKTNKINKPWFDRECQEKRRHFIQIKRRLIRKKTKSQNDTETLKQEAKLYKKFIQMKIKQFNNILHEKLRNFKIHKPKDYWKILNPKKHQKDNSITIKPLYDHFKALGDQSPSNQGNITVDDIPDEGDEILNNDFTIIELNKLINKLKNNKSSGIDNIINEFLKYSPESYKHLLLKLFNVILKTGIIPTDWCISFISPIYKNKGKKSDPNNYRGISIISCLGKLFTALINERLTKFADLNEIIGEEQAGFRAGYSTQDHIFTLHAIIETYLRKIDSQNEKKKLYCAFIDYQKAFDLVDRSCLWAKLLACNVKGKS